MKKVQVSSDTLYQFLMGHGVKLVRLAELSGISEATINVCFKHTRGTNGKPRVFTLKAIEKINAALELYATELRGCVLNFGSNQVFSNQRGNFYDPALINPMKRIGEYLNLTSLVNRTLGWSKNKKDCVLVSPSSKAYGNISEADADAINTEILAVAGVLSNYELISEDSSSSSSSEDQTVPETQKNSSTRAHAKNRCPWDNTTLSFQERTRLLKERWPQGFLLFRINGGYTVVGDDTRSVHDIDNSIIPFTDVATGTTSVYMNEEVMTRILSRLILEGRRVVITDMYDKI